MDTWTEGTGPSVLLGVHDPRAAAELQRCLEGAGYRVATVVRSGKRLLDIARRLRPDVGLVDLRLPGPVDAVDLGSALSSSLEIPVLYLARTEEDRREARARGRGSFACLPGPWDERSLGPAIEMALQRQGMERALALSERRFRILFEANPAGVVVEGAFGTILDANPAFARSLGFETTEQVRGRPLRDLVDDAPAENGPRPPTKSPAPHGREVVLQASDGRRLWAIDSVASFADPVTGAPRILHTFLDISERKELEERLVELAYHDELTGLPNRRLLELRGGQALDEARRRGDRAALVFLDLVGFKQVNDELGHQVGDAALRLVADRLRASLRTNDNVARFGGDEFVVLLSGVRSADAARTAVERLLSSLARPGRLGDQAVTPRARAGVALFPDEAPDLASLMEQADGALARAKALGGSVVVMAGDPGITAG